MNSLTANTKRIAISNTFHIVSASITSLFISAFIWKTTYSLLYVCIYNLGSYIMHPCAFYLNKQVLSSFGIKKSYVVGALLASLAILNVTFWQIYTVPILFFCGCCYGLGSGLYWSNRNFLEYVETKDTNRQYFYSIIYAIGWIADIIVPLVGGWFVVAFSASGLGVRYSAYFILFGISFFLMSLSAYWIYRTTFKGIQVPENLSSFKLGINNRRSMSIALGVCEGVGFLAPLVTLYFFKSEMAMGTLMSLSALLTALAMYVYGIYNVNHLNFKGLLVASLAYVISSLILIVYRTDVTVASFAVFSGISVSFFGLISQPILFHFIDIENRLNSTSQDYGYIIDNELFLNIGRAISVVFLLVVTVLGSDKMALLYCPSFIGLTQLIIVCITKGRYEITEAHFKNHLQ